MSTKPRDFAAKARHIVGGSSRPTSLQDFLEEAPALATEDCTEGHAENVRNTGNTAIRTEEVRNTGNTAIRTEEVRETGDKTTGTAAKRTEREEFRFDSDLAERLRRCAFETRRKKTTIVREALEWYLQHQGF